MKKIITLFITLFIISFLASSCTSIKGPDYTRERKDSIAEFNTFQENRLLKVIPEKSYTLEECLQLAVENNLQLYSLKLQQAVSDDKAMAHLLTALPSFQTSYKYNIRDNEAGATSEGIEDGLESLRASKSTDKQIGSFRLEMALSTLDFGLAYINSRFEKDQKRKAYINREKAERELKFQVAQAFYSVAAAQSVMTQAKAEILKNEETLTKVESLFDKQHISRFELLRFKKKFLESRKQLREYERSYKNHCLNLSALLGLYPDANIAVDTSVFLLDPDADHFKIHYQLPAYEKLEQNAFLMREELLEIDVEKHMSLLKQKSELLKMFPNVRLLAAFNDSSNSFLHNQNWSEAGINVIMDFMKIPSRLKNMSAEEKQRTVLKFKQFSTMLNITAQIKIASANIEEVKERLSLREDIHHIIKQEQTLTKEAYKKGQRTQLDVLEKDIDLLMSHIQRTAAFANYNVAIHRLLNISALPQKNLKISSDNE